jgi:hypothetical protein
MSSSSEFNTPMSYESISKSDVPRGREGKHKKIIAQILKDLAQLEPDRALKVPLAELPDSKENIRSALNRATRQQALEIATSSDADFLYIWKCTKKAS